MSSDLSRVIVGGAVFASTPGARVRVSASELLELVARPAWHADAACREHPEITWFPERGEHIVDARAVCAGCLVRVECLAFALEHESSDPDTHGVWGGLSRGERSELRKASNPAA